MVFGMKRRRVWPTSGTRKMASSVAQQKWATSGCYDGSFFFSSRRRHTRLQGDWSSDVCSSDLLRWRHVNVIGARQVVVIGRPQEAVTVRQDFQHAFGKNMAFFFALRLENLEDEVLLAQSAGTGQIQRSGDLGQLGNIFFFEFSYGHIHLRRFSKGGN